MLRSGRIGPSPDNLREIRKYFLARVDSLAHEGQVSEGANRPGAEFCQSFVYMDIIPSKVVLRLVFWLLMLPTKLSMAENCLV